MSIQSNARSVVHKPSSYIYCNMPLHFIVWHCIAWYASPFNACQKCMKKTHPFVKKWANALLPPLKRKQKDRVPKSHDHVPVHIQIHIQIQCHVPVVKTWNSSIVLYNADLIKLLSGWDESLVCVAHDGEVYYAMMMRRWKGRLRCDTTSAGIRQVGRLLQQTMDNGRYVL